MGFDIYIPHLTNILAKIQNVSITLESLSGPLLANTPLSPAPRGNYCLLVRWVEIGHPQSTF